MPKIQAATVAEHRAMQRRAILDAARSLLSEGDEAPSLAAVGRRAGLARSSVYQYFSSRDALMACVVDEFLPAWSRTVRLQVGAAQSPGEKVWAYARANVELFHSAEQAVAVALTKVVDPSVLAEPMTRFHNELREPLFDALVAAGEEHPDLAADVIGAMAVKVAQGTDPDGERITLDAALALLRRLLAGYLAPGDDRRV